MNKARSEQVIQIECSAYDLRGAALLTRLAVDDALRQKGQNKPDGDGFQCIHLIGEQIDALNFGVNDLVNRTEKLIKLVEGLQE